MRHPHHQTAPTTPCYSRTWAAGFTYLTTHRFKPGDSRFARIKRTHWVTRSILLSSLSLRLLANLTKQTNTKELTEQMSCRMLSSQGSTSVKDNSTERFVYLPWVVSCLPAAASSTPSAVTNHDCDQLEIRAGLLPEATPWSNHTPAKRKEPSPTQQKTKASQEQLPTCSSAAESKTWTGFSWLPWCLLQAAPLEMGFDVHHRHDRYHNLFFFGPLW